MSKSHATLSPNADTGILSPSTPTNDDHYYRTLTNSLLPPLQTPILPMTPMHIRVPTILSTTPEFHEDEQSTSSTPKIEKQCGSSHIKNKSKIQALSS